MKAFEDEEDYKWNHPTGIFHGDNPGEYLISYLMPRKEYCGSDICEMNQEELAEFCDKAIERFKIAAELFAAFRDGEVDCVYYWDKKDDGDNNEDV